MTGVVVTTVELIVRIAHWRRLRPPSADAALREELLKGQSLGAKGKWATAV